MCQSAPSSCLRLKRLCTGLKYVDIFWLVVRYLKACPPYISGSNTEGNLKSRRRHIRRLFLGRQCEAKSLFLILFRFALIQPSAFSSYKKVYERVYGQARERFLNSLLCFSSIRTCVPGVCVDLYGKYYLSGSLFFFTAPDICTLLHVLASRYPLPALFQCTHTASCICK